MDIFINEAIHNGILNYKKWLDKENINRVHIFELWVIKVLINIYGESIIIKPFEERNVDSFRKNLMMYGLKIAEVDQFLALLNEYDSWLNSPYLVTKTEIPSKIENMIINMLLLKATYQKITTEEMKEYDEFFDPQDSDLAKYKDLIIANKTVTPNLWRTKKVNLQDGLITEGIEIELLPARDYKRYGLTRREVKALSNDKIRELNARIKAEEAEDNAGGNEKFDPKKLILTSGSGFVDTIVLLSIIATQIFIGMLIAFALVSR